jgi:hypothetical protein
MTRVPPRRRHPFERKELRWPSFPAVAPIALTVTDLAVSVPWYERLLGTGPVLDEDTAGYHHTAILLAPSHTAAPFVPSPA